jgi:hypothetical protein
VSYPECRYSECHYAECLGAFLYVFCLNALWNKSPLTKPFMESEVYDRVNLPFSIVLFQPIFTSDGTILSGWAWRGGRVSRSRGKSAA